MFRGIRNHNQITFARDVEVGVTKNAQVSNAGVTMDKGQKRTVAPSKLGAVHSIKSREEVNANKFGSRELTNKELEVTRLLTQGLKNKEIAEVIGSTEHMIKNHLRGVYDKLGMHDRVEVALWYLYHIEGLK